MIQAEKMRTGRFGNIAAMLVYLAIAFLVMLPLLKPGYFFALDMPFGPSTFAESKYFDFYGLQPSSYGAYFPLRMALGAISGIIGTEGAEKLLLFSILFLCGISAHFSLPARHGNARYFSGLLYMLNPFVFVRFLAGHWSLLLSYSVWPLALLSFFQFLERPKERGPLARVALLVTFASVSSHGVIILLMCMGLMFLFHLLRRGIDAAQAKRIGLLGLLVLAMNLYWIAPTVLLFGQTYNPGAAEGYLSDFIPQTAGLPLGISLATMHGFWRGGFVYTKDIMPFWWVPFIFIAVFAFIGLASLLRERALHALFLLTVFLLGFLLAMGALGPLSWLFSIFGSDFPLFMIFRDSQKFVGMVCLSYSLLGSYGINWLMERYSRRRLLLLVAALVVPVLYNLHFFGFAFQVWTTPFPHDWLEAAQIMSDDAAPGKVLVLPPYLYNTYSWANPVQKTLSSPAVHAFPRSVILLRSVSTVHVPNDVRDYYGAYLSFVFRNRQLINNTAELLIPLDARYILVLKNYTLSDDYLWLFKRKGGVEGIELEYESDSLYLFRNTLAGGPFLATDDIGNGSFGDYYNGSLSLPSSAGVSYEKMTPAAYRVLDSGGRYLLFASPPNENFEYNGQAAGNWYNMACVYEYSGPGILSNRVFPLILALFLISWAISIALMLNPPRAALILLAIPIVPLYNLIWDGSLGPHIIGALILLSLALSLIVYSYGVFSKKSKTFLKLE